MTCAPSSSGRPTTTCACSRRHDPTSSCTARPWRRAALPRRQSTVACRRCAASSVRPHRRAPRGAAGTPDTAHPGEREQARHDPTRPAYRADHRPRRRRRQIAARHADPRTPDLRPPSRELRPARGVRRRRLRRRRLTAVTPQAARRGCGDNSASGAPRSECPEESLGRPLQDGKRDRPYRSLRRTVESRPCGRYRQGDASLGLAKRIASWRH